MRNAGFFLCRSKIDFGHNKRRVKKKGVTFTGNYVLRITLPETNISPENRGLLESPFPSFLGANCEFQGWYL